MNFETFFYRRLYAENIQIELNLAYDIFEKEYLASTGKVWPKEKFFRKAGKWEFLGDQTGYVAIRTQSNGMIKLVATAGSIKGKMKGLQELQGKSVWGIVSDTIRNILVKRGFRSPAMDERQALLHLIDNRILGDASFHGFANDGGIILEYPDLGLMTKYFVASDAFWKTVFKKPISENHSSNDKLLESFMKNNKINKDIFIESDEGEILVLDVIYK